MAVALRAGRERLKEDRAEDRRDAADREELARVLADVERRLRPQRKDPHRDAAVQLLDELAHSGAMTWSGSMPRRSWEPTTRTRWDRSGWRGRKLRPPTRPRTRSQTNPDQRSGAMVPGPASRPTAPARMVPGLFRWQANYLRSGPSRFREAGKRLDRGPEFKPHSWSIPMRGEVGVRNACDIGT